MSSSPEPSGQPGGVNIAGIVGSVGGDIVGGDKTGLSAKELVAVLETLGLLQAAETAGLQRHTIITLAQRLTPNERLDFNQAVTELERAVEVALSLIANGERVMNDGDFVDAIIKRVAAKTRSGDLDGGAHTIDEGLAELEAVHRKSRITLLEKGLQIDILRRDATAVTQRIENIVVTEHLIDRPSWSREFRKRFDAFRVDGETKGINFSLAVAVGLARRMMATARGILERGVASNLLGNVLVTLGERERGTERLEEAVVIFRAALEEMTQLPLDLVAITQNNLVTALLVLGGRKIGTECLEEAVVIVRTVLEGLTRDRAPLDWAAAQMNLAAAFRALGERESGTERLEEAVAAFRAVLEERTRDRAPRDWATTQNNLGVALLRLGQRESGTKCLEEAVVAFRAALEEITRDREPVQWAEAQYNLGYTFQTLGVQESGTAHLEGAAAAYRAALEESPRDRGPVQWACSQHGLANVLAELATRQKSATRMEEALACVRGVVEVYQQAGMSYWLPKAQALATEIEAGLVELNR